MIYEEKRVAAVHSLLPSTLMHLCFHKCKTSKVLIIQLPLILKCAGVCGVCQWGGGGGGKVLMCFVCFDLTI